MNIAVVAGTLSSAPLEQVLPSGDLLVKLEVTVRQPEQPTATVPVVVHRPGASVRALADGDAVVVVGEVRRRFFRTGAGTGSRTEVVADRVVAQRRRRDAGRAIEAAVASLSAARDLGG
jgi:single-strand DNA-binding protein